MKLKTIAWAWVPLLLLCAYLGYNLWARSQEQLLWGYRPLFLFLSGWLGIVGLVNWLRLRRGKPVAWHRLAWSTLSGLLLGVGFPDILPVPFLLFIAWVPLLLVEADLRRSRERYLRVFLGHVYHTAVLWNIIATYWVANSALGAGLFAVLVNSALMCLPFALFLPARRAMPRLGYAPLIAYWLCFEYLHYHWDLTWPWLTLGNGFAEFPALVQWYEYTGVFGGSLWVWVMNILALRAWQGYRGAESFRPDLLRLGILLVLPIGLSLLRYFTYQERGTPVDVVVVQPNYEPHYQKFDLPESRQVEHYLQLSLSALDTAVDYLVYPETSFGYLEETAVNAYPAITRLRQGLAEFPNLLLVTGLNAYYDLQPTDEPTAATRTRTRPDGTTMRFEVLNLAAQLPIGERGAQTYRKSKLVPGPESFPFKKILFFMEPVVDQLGGTTAGIGTQPERSVFTSDRGAIAPVICYESVFGEYYAGYVRKGAQAAFIMTNDGWWDHTAGHRQHLHFASLRAIETRRPIARSANTGVSAFINQRGDILQATRYNEAAAISGTILLNDQPTFYVRWGDFIARVALFAGIIFFLNSLVRGLIARSPLPPANQ